MQLHVRTFLSVVLILCSFVVAQAQTRPFAEVPYEDLKGVLVEKMPAKELMTKVLAQAFVGPLAQEVVKLGAGSQLFMGLLSYDDGGSALVGWYVAWGIEGRGLSKVWSTPLDKATLTEMPKGRWWPAPAGFKLAPHVSPAVQWEVWLLPTTTQLRDTPNNNIFQVTYRGELRYVLVRE
jgi:hypothetical protein